MSASSTQKKRGFLPGKSGELEEESWRVAWYYEFNYKTTFSPVYDLRSLSATIINKTKREKRIPRRWWQSWPEIRRWYSFWIALSDYDIYRALFIYILLLSWFSLSSLTLWFWFWNISKWLNSLVTRSFLLSFWQVNDRVFRLNVPWYSICTILDVITDVNECESSPCLNGASCIDLDNGYRCQCIEGWQGDTCHQGKIISPRCHYLELCTNKLLPLLFIEIPCFTL